MQEKLFSEVPIHELVNLIASEVEDRIQKNEYKEPQDDRIGLSEVETLIGLKRSAIYKMTMKDTIPYAKYGKRLIFSRKELKVWMEARIQTMPNPDAIMNARLSKTVKKNNK